MSITLGASSNKNSYLSTYLFHETFLFFIFIYVSKMLYDVSIHPSEVDRRSFVFIFIYWALIFPYIETNIEEVVTCLLHCVSNYRSDFDRRSFVFIFIYWALIVR